MALKWYENLNGEAYGSDGNFGDREIPARPDENHVWKNGSWVVKSSAEKDKEKDNLVDKEIAGSKTLRALLLVIADLHSLTEKDVTDQVKTKYKTL